MSTSDPKTGGSKQEESTLKVALSRCVTVRAAYIKILSCPNLSSLASDLQGMHEVPKDVKFIGRRLPMPKLERILQSFQGTPPESSTKDESSLVDLQRAMHGDADAEVGELHVIADLRGVGGPTEKQCACFAGRFWARGANREAEKRSRYHRPRGFSSVSAGTASSTPIFISGYPMRPRAYARPRRH